MLDLTVELGLGEGVNRSFVTEVFAVGTVFVVEVRNVLVGAGLVNSERVSVESSVIDLTVGVCRTVELCTVGVVALVGSVVLAFETTLLSVTGLSVKDCWTVGVCTFDRDDLLIKPDVIERFDMMDVAGTLLMVDCVVEVRLDAVEEDAIREEEETLLTVDCVVELALVEVRLDFVERVELLDLGLLDREIVVLMELDIVICVVGLRPAELKLDFVEVVGPSEEGETLLEVICVLDVRLDKV